MKISVIIISYNQDQYLEDTIKSVIDQDYQEKEIILIDGGSSDTSLSIIEKYSEHFEYWVSEADSGQSEAIIKGFSKSSGEIISWINSDDLLLPRTLGVVAKKVQNTGDINAVYIGGCQVIDEFGVVKDRFKYGKFNYFVAKTFGPTICQPGTFFGRSAYMKIGGVKSNLRYGMDSELFHNFLFSGYSFYDTGAYHAQFRKHSNQKGHSKQYLEQCRIETDMIKEKYGLNELTISRLRIARTFEVFQRVSNGYYFNTLVFRLFTRGSIKEFNTSYSS